MAQPEKWRETHDFTGGGQDAFIILKPVEVAQAVASLQIITDAAFNGTNSKVRFYQSNNPNLDSGEWHPLPEISIALVNGGGSTLLATFSFTCKYLAVQIDAGNATAGKASMITNLKRNT